MTENYEIINSKKPIRGLTIILFILVFVVIGFLTYLLFTNKKIKTEKLANQYTEQTSDSKTGFTDGLKNPNSIKTFSLDEFGEGIASTEVFNIDINNDNIKDRITRSRYENGTPHFYYDYKIELNNGDNFIDITPKNFRTVEGAECSLQKLKFIFEPEFRLIKITREWKDSWDTPTIATKYVYKLSNNNLEIISANKLKEICNVSDLF